MLDSGPDRGRGILATTILVSCLASFVVALRLATRTWIVRSVGWDDYTIICATFGIIISSGLVAVQVHYGFGRHKSDLTQWQYIEFMKYSYGEWIQTFQTLMFNKISICFFLLRIPVEKHLIRPIQIAVVGLVFSNIILTFVWIFQCNPVVKAWHKQVEGTCMTDAQLLRVIISQAIISIISDVGLALFPIVLLWKVQIAVRIKAGLCALMALGLITAACCIVRTVLNYQNINDDTSWNSIDNWYWRSWEVCIGIIAACIPALRPGYRTVTASVTAYLSNRSLRRSSERKTSDPSLVDKPSTSVPESAQRMQASTITHPQATYDPAIGAAKQELRTQADRAKEFGEGQEGFAMRSLPGDKQPAHEGIKKTTRIEIGKSGGGGSQGSLDLGDVERGLGHRDFL